MATKICPKCGEEKDARGFHFHVNKCTGTLEAPVAVVEEESIEKLEIKKVKAPTKLPTELPGLAIAYGMMEALQDEAKKTRAMQDSERIAVERAQVCNCKDYDGQSFNCPIHKAKVECPKCHSVGVEIKCEYMEPCQTYRCGICGFACKRNMVTGDYLYA